MQLKKLHRVIEVEALGSYRLGLTFGNRTYKEIDLQPWLEKQGFGMFEPLLDKEYFAQVALDPILGTIVWPNGADLCPDVLYAYPDRVKLKVAYDAAAADPSSDDALAWELQAPQNPARIRSQIREQHGHYQSNSEKPAAE